MVSRRVDTSRSGWVRWSQDVFKKKRLSETLELTLKLFLEGKSVDEIAKEREFERGTVEKHLLDLITKSFIRAEDVIGRETLDLILSKIDDSNVSSLSMIKEVLPDKISFFEVKCALAYLSAQPLSPRKNE